MTLVHDFLAAYNSGAPDIVTRYIAPKPRFQWFAQPDRPFPSGNAQATDRDSLAAYLTKRHRLGDHYRLTSLRVSDLIDSFDNRGFVIQMSLSGSVHPPRQYGGKGSVTCDTGQLAVWLITS